MEVRLTWDDGCANNGERAFEVPDCVDESAFWGPVAKRIREIPMPFAGDPDLAISVACPLGSCALDVKGRDEHMVEGTRVASPAIFPAVGSEGGIPGLAPGAYPEKYLTFCSEESAGGRGSYKFYRFIPNPDGTIGAEYGRIGQNSGFGAPRRVKTPYPGWMFHIKLAEKLMKGYRDESKAYLDERRSAADGKDRPRPALEALSASQRLFRLLTEAAHARAARDLRFPDGVTVEQVREARRLIREMGRRKTVKAFNRQLKLLLQVAPRNLYAVREAMAESESDMPSVIAREEDVLAAMEGVVGMKRARGEAGGSAPSFDALGVHVQLASARQRAEVESRLSGRLRAKVREVYAVDCARQSERFEAWVASRGIKDVRSLWHGSPAANWASILENSLWVPQAGGVAHGAMFGRGIYFGSNGAGADSAADGGGEKSWGYVGASDSYWDRARPGGARDVYMALFDVAYGNPCSPAWCQSYTQRELDERGFDCVHARRGTSGLRNDEIVVYDERAVRIRYLVRFEA